jgi:hypothetical protein
VTVSDQPFYAPNRKVPPRQPRAGERLWTVEKNGRQLACELRDDGEAGVEVQVYRDGDLLYGRRHATRAAALEEADDQQARYSPRGRDPYRVAGRGRRADAGLLEVHGLVVREGCGDVRFCQVLSLPRSTVRP